ncbi:hypothetical protein AMK59_615 [Oryctes borbonicus]|uniref:Gustatory receptor n=1 Tax=Oryctes borbonicus TaxID=1629725 RepID=A0A0T6BCR2_9SCAR|nr:hypothetical protein AMK59_615 [Oryctes borbonicus]
MKFTEKTFSSVAHPKNFTTLKYLLLATGVIPCFRLNGRNLMGNKLNILYFLFVISVIIACTVMIIITRGTFWNNKDFLQSFIGLTAPLLISFLTFHSTTSLHLWKNEKYHEFASLFDRIDTIVHRYIRKSPEPNRKSMRKMIFWKTVFPIIFCVSHITYTSILVSWWFCLETLMRHLMTFRVVLLQHHIQQVGYRYEVVERIVLYNMKQFMRGQLKEAELKLALHDMAKILASLSDLIRLFNELFGWTLFTLTLSIIMGILMYINNAIVFFGMLDVKWVAIFIFWSCFHYYLSIILASASAQTTKKARSLGKTSLNLMVALRSSPIKMKMISACQLMVLASRAYVNPPIFSIQGFFIVDYKWFFFIVNFTTSYIVVLLYYIGSSYTS